MRKAELLLLVSPALADKYYQPIVNTIKKYNIDTPLRQAHFLAQLLHESGNLKYNQEIASGSSYEGRKDLGNTQVGDGMRFKGRGPIMLTGRYAYKSFGDYIGKDLISHPELVANDPYIGMLAAGWFWESRKLNGYADKDDVLTITKLINGGTNGLRDRINKLNKAKGVIKGLEQALEEIQNVTNQATENVTNQATETVKNNPVISVGIAFAGVILIYALINTLTTVK